MDREELLFNRAQR
jgi:hypothetical protein